jgi:NitT/TauT family transport system ATP-binding protein
MKISVADLSLSFSQGVEVLKDVSFEVGSGEFVTIVGPSGCGKSTVLNAIASLIGPGEAVVTGSIHINDAEIREGRLGNGALGYVFQRDTLFPWRTVLRNVEAGLELRGMPKSERETRARQLINLVGLAGFEQYFPHQISGGMRQRASLIRTLAYDPQVVLMDEPFGALDAQTRMSLQAELIRIWAARRKTIVFVTHDLAEAIMLGERVIVFSKRPGTVKRIVRIPFPHPRDPFELYGSREFADFQADIWRTVSLEFRIDRLNKTAI